MKDKRRIYIDCDGVLANLGLKLTEIYGKDYKELSSNQLWSSIRDDHHNFFSDLEPYDGAKEFVKFIVETYKDHYVAILTALPWPTGNLITVDQDKRQWIREYINQTIPIHTLIGGVNKKEYINNPGDILIDDTQKVLDNWTEKKGIGILHASFENTLNELHDHVR
jgi:5'-nucleotidase